VADLPFDIARQAGPGSAIRAVLFDVGGPLDTEVEFERLIDADIRAALSAEGIEVSDAQYAAAEEWAIGCFASNAYWSIVYRLSGGDAEIARRAVVAVSDGAPRRRRARGGIELRPGITGVLERLAARRMTLGLATNHPGSIRSDLDRAGIGRFFDHRVSSEPHDHQKPDLRLFLGECAALGAEPAECIMVGDRVDNDIVPANLLGMRTVLFRTGRHIAQQPRSWDEVPDAEVWDLAQLERAIDHLISG
jgi:putative hydrolase of the HAD superfamily